LCAALAACFSCAGLPQRLRWTPASQPLSDLEPEWTLTHEVMAGGVRIKAMNSGRDLHLRFDMDDKILQDEFSGQYGQSVLLWFASGKTGHGLRVDFKPKAGATLSEDPIDAMDRSITLLGPASEGYPRPWTDGTEGVELDAFMDSGTLVYELRLPLTAETPGAFGLDLKPGSPVQISIGTSPLSWDSQSDLESEAAASAAASYDPDAIAPMPLRYRRRNGSPGSGAPSAAYSTVLNVQLATPPRG